MPPSGRPAATSSSDPDRPPATSAASAGAGSPDPPTSPALFAAALDELLHELLGVLLEDVVDVGQDVVDVLPQGGAPLGQVAACGGALAGLGTRCPLALSS